MNLTRRRGAIAFFITLGVCLTALAVTLNITWIHNNGRRLAIDLVGILLFSLLIAGVVLNTVFLVREIRRNERQDSFLNAVTHELKTPIASIRLYLDTLERRTVDEAQRHKFYAVMRSDTDRLLVTVERVLKAGELGQRGREHQRTRVELHPLVADCIKITLARHHLPPNGVAIDCRLHIEHYTWVVLSITDTGIGIPSRELKRIFKRFYRARSNDLVKIKGTGLGLFLVSTIARQHDGSVRATSEGPGKGSTMLLKLPLAIGGGQSTTGGTQ